MLWKDALNFDKTKNQMFDIRIAQKTSYIGRKTLKLTESVRVFGIQLIRWTFRFRLWFDKGSLVRLFSDETKVKVINFSIFFAPKLPRLRQAVPGSDGDRFSVWVQLFGWLHALLEICCRAISGPFKRIGYIQATAAVNT